MSKKQDVQVHRQGIWPERNALIDVGNTRRLVLTIPPHADNDHPDEIILECFVRTGRLGFKIRPKSPRQLGRNAADLVAVPDGYGLEIYTRPWEKDE